jgi:hypothetical protein
VVPTLTKKKTLRKMHQERIAIDVGASVHKICMWRELSDFLPFQLIRYAQAVSQKYLDDRISHIAACKNCCAVIYVIHEQRASECRNANALKKHRIQQVFVYVIDAIFVYRADAKWNFIILLQIGSAREWLRCDVM